MLSSSPFLILFGLHVTVILCKKETSVKSWHTLVLGVPSIHKDCKSHHVPNEIINGDGLTNLFELLGERCVGVRYVVHENVMIWEYFYKHCTRFDFLNGSKEIVSIFRSFNVVSEEYFFWRADLIWC